MVRKEMEKQAPAVELAHTPTHQETKDSEALETSGIGEERNQVTELLVECRIRD